MQNTKSLPKETLPFREVLCYGMGDMACSMVFNFMSSYLLYYYTDVSGLTAGTAGILMGCARFLDALANPAVGVCADKTHSRWGKLRPYLLFSTLPLALSVVFMFLTARISANVRSIYAFSTYTLFCLLYTVCNVPYSAMMPNISTDPRQRNRLNMSRFVCASMGSLLSMGLSIPLVSLFSQGDEQRGFSGLSLLFAFIIIALLLICFANTCERIQPSPAAFSLKTLNESMGKSRPWIILCAAQFLHYIALTTRSSTTLYYAKYCLGDENFAALLLAVNAFTALAAAFMLPPLSAKVSKRTVSIWGYTLFAAGSLLIYWSGINHTVVFLLNVLANAGISLSACVAPLELADAIDHSEYATGIQQQGFLTSVSMFMVKSSGIFSSIISGIVLSLGGYATGQQQTAKVIFAIKINFIFLPFFFGLLCIILFLFYHLDREYPTIYEALHKERTAQ